MPTDLGAMSRKELMKLQKDVEKALVAVELRDRQNARKAAEAAVAEFGFTLDEVSDGKPKKSGKGSKAEAKYRNPADPSQTWTGRGRKPNWVHEALANGADITDMEI